MSEKILVVDDEQNIRDSSVKLLQKKGYDAKGAESGEDAIIMIQKESFDLLLLDVRMPGMDGIEVLRKVTELMPDIQVVMLTGHGNIDMAIEALEYGAIGFLRKPIAIDDLQMSIEDALTRGNTRRENTRLRALMPLFELNQQLLSELNEGKLVDIILKTVTSEIGADNTEITLWDEDGTHIKKFATNDSAFNLINSFDTDDFVNKAATTNKTLIFSTGDEKLLESPDDIHLIQSGYDIYIPLITINKSIGVLKVSKIPPHRPLQPSDLDFLFTLCSQSSIGISNARLYDSLEKAHVEVEELLKRVISTTEDERLRISLELHDGPIQSIIAAQFSVQACRAMLDDDMPLINEKMQNIGKTLLESTHNLRRIVSDLHPPDLEKSGLISAIQEYLGIIENEDRLKCHIKVKGKMAKLMYSAERGLYYIIREAVTNIKKHAEASTITVTIDNQDDKLTINIFDDGKGFDPSKVEHNSTYSHVGIRSIRERARVLHSDLTISSTIGEGTDVQLVVPLNYHAHQQPSN
ncbi:response regulator [Chloroflexota bacterium]